MTEAVSSREKILLGDGQLIHLVKLSPFGEPMSLGVRHIKYPFREFGKHAMFLEPTVSFALLNIYAKKGDKLNPLGHKDWEINGRVAHEGFNQHGFVIHTNAHEAYAKKNWRYSSKAFQVIEDYQRYGLGIFLTAVSLEFLKSQGIDTLMNRDLTDGSRRTWARLGVIWEGKSIPFSFVSYHPLIEKILAEYLGD